MGLDDLFEAFDGHRKRRHDQWQNENHHEKRYDHDNDWKTENHSYYHGKEHDHDEYARILSYAKRILHNKKLLIPLLIVALTGCVLLVVAGIWLLSQTGTIIGYLEKNGLKSIVDYGLIVLQRLWEGSGN